MFKYVLVPCTGEERDAAVFAAALTVARLSAAHLLFLHVQPDTQRLLMAMTSAAETGIGTGYRGTVEAIEQRGAERNQRAALAFRKFCQGNNLAVPGDPSLHQPSAEWQLEVGDETECLSAYGRAADLVVTGRARDGAMVDRGMLAACLMRTGRPVLIAPTEAPVRLTGTVAIAWKDCPEAARAVAAARPFIEMADHVVIFSVDEGMELGEQSCARLRTALSWQNPNVVLQHLRPDGQSAVEILLGAAGAAKADLLVMGGYGHSRARELFFGGFTRHVLNAADLPVLMTH